MTPVETAYRDATAEKEYQNRLVMEELPQVYYIARRIHERLPQHVAFEDLVHAGVLGLIEALRKYDASKNVQFKSFAQFRIRGAILDSLRELDWGSRRLRRKARSIDQATERLAAKLGRQPDEEEIAAELGIQLTALHQLLSHLDGLELVGQQTPSGEDRSETFDLIESAAAPAAESPFHECLRGEMKKALARAIASLSEKEQQVISLYYREELTMKEIAAVLEVVESRVSQLHTAALAKLRAALQQMAVEGVAEFISDSPREA
jgi:RNA polymerase sigma factor for flagellar operon FliA